MNSIIPQILVEVMKKVAIIGIVGLPASYGGFERFAECCAVRFADSVVGDNQVIVDYVRNHYHRDCQLIEYGADNRKLVLS